MIFLSILLILLIANGQITQVVSNNKAPKKPIDICKGKSKTLTCKDGDVISITSALYGRESYDKSECVWSLPGSCKFNVTEKLRNMCNCSSQCKVTANNDKFGNPCRTFIKDISEYLKVTYKCLAKTDHCFKANPTQATLTTAMKSVDTSTSNFGEPSQQSTLISSSSAVASTNQLSFYTSLATSSNNSEKNRLRNKSTGNNKKKNSSRNSQFSIWIIIGVAAGLLIPLACFIIFILWKKKICCKCGSKKELGDHIYNYPDDVFEEDRPQSTGVQMEKNELYGEAENDYVFFGEKNFPPISETLTPVSPTSQSQMGMTDNELYETR